MTWKWANVPDTNTGRLGDGFRSGDEVYLGGRYRVSIDDGDAAQDSILVELQDVSAPTATLVDSQTFATYPSAGGQIHKVDDHRFLIRTRTTSALDMQFVVGDVSGGTLALTGPYTVTGTSTMKFGTMEFVSLGANDAVAWVVSDHGSGWFGIWYGLDISTDTFTVTNELTVWSGRASQDFGLDLHGTMNGHVLVVSHDYQLPDTAEYFSEVRNKAGSITWSTAYDIDHETSYYYPEYQFDDQIVEAVRWDGVYPYYEMRLRKTTIDAAGAATMSDSLIETGSTSGTPWAPMVAKFDADRYLVVFISGDMWEHLRLYAKDLTSYEEIPLNPDLAAYSLNDAFVVDGSTLWLIYSNNGMYHWLVYQGGAAPLRLFPRRDTRAIAGVRVHPRSNPARIFPRQK